MTFTMHNQFVVYDGRYGIDHHDSKVNRCYHKLPVAKRVMSRLIRNTGNIDIRLKDRSLGKTYIWDNEQRKIVERE